MIFWYFGILTFGHFGILTFEHCGTLAFGQYGTLALWHLGSWALWHCRIGALLHCGIVALWRCGMAVVAMRLCNFASSRTACATATMFMPRLWMRGEFLFVLLIIFSYVFVLRFSCRARGVMRGAHAPQIDSKAFVARNMACGHAAHPHDACRAHALACVLTDCCFPENTPFYPLRRTYVL